MKDPPTTDELEKQVLENQAKIEEIRKEIQKILCARTEAAVKTELETEGGLKIG